MDSEDDSDGNKRIEVFSAENMVAKTRVVKFLRERV